MAKSTFAKFAERISVAVIALIVIAWAVLTFFMDDPQETGADQPVTVDQTDEVGEPDADTKTDQGVGAPEQGEAAIGTADDEATDSTEAATQEPTGGAADGSEAKDVRSPGDADGSGDAVAPETVSSGVDGSAGDESQPALTVSEPGTDAGTDQGTGAQEQDEAAIGTADDEATDSTEAATQEPTGGAADGSEAEDVRSPGDADGSGDAVVPETVSSGVDGSAGDESQPALTVSEPGTDAGTDQGIGAQEQDEAAIGTADDEATDSTEAATQEPTGGAANGSEAEDVRSPGDADGSGEAGTSEAVSSGVDGSAGDESQPALTTSEPDADAGAARGDGAPEQGEAAVGAADDEAMDSMEAATQEPTGGAGDGSEAEDVRLPSAADAAGEAGTSETVSSSVDQPAGGESQSALEDDESGIAVEPEQSGGAREQGEAAVEPADDEATDLTEAATRESADGAGDGSEADDVRLPGDADESGKATVPETVSSSVDQAIGDDSRAALKGGKPESGSRAPDSESADSDDRAAADQTIAVDCPTNVQSKSDAFVDGIADVEECPSSQVGQFADDAPRSEMDGKLPPPAADEQAGSDAETPADDPVESTEATSDKRETETSVQKRAETGTESTIAPPGADESSQRDAERDEAGAIDRDGEAENEPAEEGKSLKSAPAARSSDVSTEETARSPATDEKHAVDTAESADDESVEMPERTAVRPPEEATESTEEGEVQDSQSATSSGPTTSTEEIEKPSETGDASTQERTSETSSALEKLQPEGIADPASEESANQPDKAAVEDGGQTAGVESIASETGASKSSAPEAPARPADSDAVSDEGEGSGPASQDTEGPPAAQDESTTSPAGISADEEDAAAEPETETPSIQTSTEKIPLESTSGTKFSEETDESAESDLASIEGDDSGDAAAGSMESDASRKLVESSKAVESDTAGTQPSTSEIAAAEEPSVASEDEDERSASEPSSDARDGAGRQVAKLDVELDAAGKTAAADSGDRSVTPEQDDAPVLPTFDVVRVDQYGFMTIAGRGMPDSEIEVFVNFELEERGRAGKDGQFAFILQLDTESGPMEIALLSRDARGTEHRSAETIVVFMPESVVDPSLERRQLASANELVPAVVLATPEGVKLEQPPVRMKPSGIPGTNLQIDSISYDMLGEAVLAGRGSAEGFVRIYLDNVPVKTERISNYGTWVIDLPEVDAGRYALKIEELDESGKVVASVTTPFQKEFQEDAIEIMKDAAQSSGKSDIFGVADGRIADIVTVQPGYTLWAISRRSFGQGRFYVRIYHANIDQINDPDLIFPGQLLVIPNLDTVPPRRPFN